MAEKRIYKKSLNQLRQSLEAIDAQLVLHLVQRFKISEQIAAVKAEEALKTEDLGREQVVLDACKATAVELGASEKQLAYILALMSAVIDKSKTVQEDTRHAMRNSL